MSSKWVDRYLAVIGLQREPPSYSALATLTSAHIRSIPFANVTSLLRRAAHPRRQVPPPDAMELLQEWEHGRGGGVCFELVPMFNLLLESFGYRVTPILAQISFPGSHSAVMVELDGARYIVDVGNGAPFFEPIPMDTVTEVHRAGLSFRFRPGESAGEFHQDRLIHGKWSSFCRYDLRPADDDDRQSGYQMHHTPGQSWVVDRLRIVRCGEAEVISLADDELVRYSESGKHEVRITDLAGYVRIAADLFQLPALPIGEAIVAKSEIAGSLRVG